MTIDAELSTSHQWHATTAEKDVGWTEDLFTKVFATNNFADLTLQDFGAAVGTAWSTMVDPNPKTREFGGCVSPHTSRVS